MCLLNHGFTIVINKSPGISVHRDQAETGLLEIIKREQHLDELYLVHRLDKMTSGLLLLAKNSTANSILSELFAQRAVEKYYLALSDRKPKKKQGLIKGDMEKARRGAWKLTKTYTHPAITQFFSHAIGNGERLFILRPYTGKTHQLRVALKSIAAPILGDTTYNTEAEAGPMDRGYLHSYVLGFNFNATPYRYVLMPSQGERFLAPGFVETMEFLPDPADYDWPRVAG